jgi:hypothetical protein
MMSLHRASLAAMLLACLFSTRAAAAAAPTVEANGSELTLRSGDGGDVSLVSADGVVTLAQLLNMSNNLRQAVADIVRTH